MEDSNDLERVDSDFKWKVFSIFEKFKKVLGYNLKDEEYIKYAVENWNGGDVIVNYSKEGQKYILVVDSNDKRLIFVTDNLPHHINIKHKYVPNWLCLWWWCVTIDDKNNYILLYWKSKAYGKIHWEVKEAMIKMLKENYPNYKILFEK